MFANRGSWRCAGLFLAALCTVAACATTIKDTFVIGEVPKRDTDRPIYQVHLPDVGQRETTFNPPDADLPRGMTTMRMVTANGQAMRCLIPELRKPKRHSSGQSPDAASSAEEAAAAEAKRFDDIDDVLRVYENKCFLREDGWWTYEFCYGRHIVQKHIIPQNRHPMEDEKEVEIVLGKLDKEADLIRRKNASLVSLPDAAYTQLFENGTECDLNGMPRRAVVKYMCSEDALQLPISSSSGASSKKSKLAALNVLNKVRELESCVYEIEFLNSAICQHATYKEKAADAVKQIHCSVEGEEPFQGLKSDSYHRSSLSL